MPSQKYTIICDTREKTPWSFKETETCTGSIIKKVDYGDYSIAGLEDLIFIERKATPSEIAGNITEARFKKLLKTASSFKYKFIICEFSLPNLLSFPYSSSLPKRIVKTIRIKGPFILSQLQNYSIEYGMNVVFCDNALNAQKYVESLFKKINEIENV